MIYLAKRNYYKQELKNHKGNTKPLYKLMSKLTGGINAQPMPDGKSNNDIAEHFAEYFLQNIVKIRDYLSNVELYNPVWYDVTFPLSNFSVLMETEIKQSISKLQTKSCELDLVPTKILKENLDYFIKAITHVVNLSLQIGQFDDDWKCVVLRPLMKKLNGPRVNNNYRPVSSLPFISKLVEKCVQGQFVNHNVNSCLNSEFQRAYRPGHSCETALLQIMNDLLWAMERQSVSVLILLDLSAAFDTVDNQVLLNILERKFGIKDVALK